MTDTTSEHAAIAAVLEELAAGHRAKDPKRIVAGYAPELVSYSLAPPLATRAGDLTDIRGQRVDMTTAEGVAVWLGGFGDGAFDYQLTDLEVTASDDVAFAHGLARMGVEGLFGMWFRLTAGLRKLDGNWKITHLHASTPFYMDETMKAAVDLEP